MLGDAYQAHEGVVFFFLPPTVLLLRVGSNAHAWIVRHVVCAVQCSGNLIRAGASKGLRLWVIEV